LSENRVSALSGKVICITRAFEEAQKMAELVKKRGGIPFIFPTVKQEFVAPADEELEKLKNINDYETVIFTSANGVRFFLKAAELAGISSSGFKGKIACVGSQTAAFAASVGLTCGIMPDEFLGVSLAEIIKRSVPKGARILYPRPRKVSRDLKQMLEPEGYKVDEVIVYETVPDGRNREEAGKKLRNGEIDALTFTSGSTVRFFVEILKDELNLNSALNGVIVAVIGPSTKKAAEKLGIRIDVVPEEFTVPSMLDALEKAFLKQV
jgi:uroporphyrinogen-III synthase